MLPRLRPSLQPNLCPRPVEKKSSFISFEKKKVSVRHNSKGLRLNVKQFDYEFLTYEIDSYYEFSSIKILR